MQPAAKILIVDDHPSFVEGVDLLLRSILPVAQVSHAHNGKECLAHLVADPEFDWIFLDIKLPDLSGIELLRRFHLQKIIANSIVMTSEDSPDLIDEVLNCHASGFLTKSFDRLQLAAAIAEVERGKIYLSPEHALQLKHFRTNQLLEKQMIKQNISQRQNETLSLIAKGFSNAEIAANLCISEHTVKTHVSRLMELFEADNRTHCVAEARRLKLLD